MPTSAAAFYDPATFAAQALEGGGAGRFFTGSPADGQTCETCHTGGEPPAVYVSGLPARYVPGATYELLVSWSVELGDVGAMLEISDEHGAGAGTLALPPANEVSDEELCEPRSQHILGARLLDASDGRTIAGLGGCGASAVRVQWTAPRASVGRVWLAGAVVASNQQGDMEGDGVTTFLEPVASFGQQASSSPHDGCSISMGARGSSAATSFAAFALGLLLLRRRRPKRMRSSQWYFTACLIAACSDDPSIEPSSPQSSGAVTLHRGGAVEAWETPEPPVDGGSALDPPAEARDVGDAGDAQAPPSAPFQFRVTTLPQGGTFAPKNIGAIWVEDANRAWVRTLALWATVSLRYLSRYVKANRDGNTVDAITSATFNAHQEHAVAWNFSGARGQTIPDGTYHLMVEVTDRNGPGQVLDIEFVTGPDPATIVPADVPAYVNAELVLSPSD